MTSSPRDEGAVLIEAALVFPVFIILLVGGLIFGLATVDYLRLDRAAGDAVLLAVDDARLLVAAVGGRVVCWWRGDDTGGCFDDGLTFERTQLIAQGRTWVYPTGSITPTVQVVRPTEGEP